MPIYNFFKSLFGIPDSSDRSESYRNHRPFNHNTRDHGNQTWADNDEEDYRNTPEQDDDSFQGFNMFVDPLEIHRYFEQQMGEMLKSFEGFFKYDDNSSPDFGRAGGFSSIIEPHYPQIEPRKESLRDQYLKPGYERARSEQLEKPPDTDLDGKIDMDNLDSILGDKPGSRQQIVPKPNTGPRMTFFGQSMTSKRVQRPDGSIEVHKTVRDHEGNEETTVTKQMGDKQYTLTTRRTKDGREEMIEDIVNMEEKDLNQFVNIWKPEDDPNKHFPFDKFFK